VEAEKSGLDSGSSKCESDKLIEPATGDHATYSSIYLDLAGAGMSGGMDPGDPILWRPYHEIEQCMRGVLG
jgi:hypothetical protein